MTRKVRPGDKTIPAENLNLQTRAAASVGARMSGGASRSGIHQQFGSGYQPQDSDVVLIRNDTGCDLSRFETVGMDYLVNDEEMPTYGASRPNACRHTGRIAVLAQDIPNGRTGLAAVSGLSPMYTPQMGEVGILRSYDDNSTTTLPPMSVDAGYFGTGDSMQRALGLHKVDTQGSAGVLYYDDIGTEYQDFAQVRLRNPGSELVEANKSRCQCADGSCTYKCMESGGSYSWTLQRQDCDRADIKFSEDGWLTAPTEDDSYQHTSCSCEGDPLTSRACDSSTVNEYLTVPCIAPESTVGTVLFADTDEFCGQYCLWHGETLIRGCDESCNSDCACLSPLELGSLTGTIRVGDKIPTLYRTPCIRIDEGGVCIHMAGDNGWSEVYNNCSSQCPCKKPEVSHTNFPPGYRFVQDCNRSRCIPCSPAGACRWKYSERTVWVGFWPQTYAEWELVSSTCLGSCECSNEPPGYTGLIGVTPFDRYQDGEVVTVPCCKSPLGSPCDPTTTSTTTPAPTTTKPPDPCGCTSPTHYCEWTCSVSGGFGLRWQNTYSVCCNTSAPKYCSCGRGFVQPYACTLDKVGHKAYSECTPRDAPSSSFVTAVATLAQLVQNPTTTTTTTTTTSYPTVDPSTTEEITASYVMSSEGTTAQPTCRTICVKASPTLDENGQVHQSGYTAMEVGTEIGLCSRFGDDHACILFSPCDSSTAGQVLEGICKRVDRNV